MFSKSQTKLALLVLCTVMVAGCTGGGSPIPASDTGLEIISWLADQTDVSGIRSVRFAATLENQGQNNVNNTTALITLIGSNLDVTGSSTSSWGNTTANENEWRLFDKSLRAEDPLRNITAEQDIYRWTLKSPLLPRGQSKTDSFIARVYYEYATDARGTIWAYSETEAAAKRDVGEALETATFITTRGPIDVEVSVSPDPPVLTSDDKSFVLTLKLSNVGGGTIYKTGSINYANPAGDMSIDQMSELNWVNVAVTAPTGVTVGSDCLGPQEIIGGRDLAVMCDVSVSTPPATFKGYPLTFKVTYGYYKDATLSVTTTGR